MRTRNRRQRMALPHTMSKRRQNLRLPCSPTLAEPTKPLASAMEAFVTSDRSTREISHILWRNCENLFEEPEVHRTRWTRWTVAFKTPCAMILMAEWWLLSWAQWNAFEWDVVEDDFHSGCKVSLVSQRPLGWKEFVWIWASLLRLFIIWMMKHNNCLLLDIQEMKCRDLVCSSFVRSIFAICHFL